MFYSDPTNVTSVKHSLVGRQTDSRSIFTLFDFFFQIFFLSGSFKSGKARVPRTPFRASLRGDGTEAIRAALATEQRAVAEFPPLLAFVFCRWPGRVVSDNKAF